MPDEVTFSKRLKPPTSTWHLSPGIKKTSSVVVKKQSCFIKCASSASSTQGKTSPGNIRRWVILEIYMYKTFILTLFYKLLQNIGSKFVFDWNNMREFFDKMSEGRIGGSDKNVRSRSLHLMTPDAGMQSPVALQDAPWPTDSWDAGSLTFHISVINNVTLRALMSTVVMFVTLGPLMSTVVLLLAFVWTFVEAKTKSLILIYSVTENSQIQLILSHLKS